MIKAIQGKTKRAGSTKFLESSIRGKVSDSHASRRNASSRSEITIRNKSMLAMDGLGFCCSGHGNRIKRVSELQRPKSFRLQSRMQQTESKKITKIKTRREISKQASAKGHFTIDSQSIVKTKKQKKNSSYKPTKQTIKTKRDSRKSEDGVFSSKRQQPHFDEQISMNEINPFDVSEGRRRKLIQTRKNQEAKKDGSNDYLIRQPTLNHLKDGEDQAGCLDIVEEKHETESKSYEPPRQSSKLSSKLPQLDLRSILESEQTIKKQLQKYQEEAISQLKLTNSKLHQQLFEACQKYENAMELKNKQIDQIRNSNNQELKSLKINCQEMKFKLLEIQRQCEILRSEKQQLVLKFHEDLRCQRKEAFGQRQSLIKKIAEIEQSQRKLIANASRIQEESQSLRSQIGKLELEKQKYERGLRKYENEVHDLEAKLELEMRRNKQQAKELEILRKEKEYIKQNSELVLEIVRNQIRDMNGNKSCRDQNAEGLSKEVNGKFPWNLSPKKRRVLQSNNLESNPSIFQ